MKLLHNNLVAIAYRGGFCGSLITAILSLSPEVQKFSNSVDLEFSDSTAHKDNEQWFKNLHTYHDATVTEETFNLHLTPQILQAFDHSGLILFRCHHNVAYALRFIENLKIIYITGEDVIKYQRWYYNKKTKRSGDWHYQDSLQRRFGVTREFRLNNRLRRQILIDDWDHHSVNYLEVQAQVPNTFILNIDKILINDLVEYQRLCEFLKITPVGSDKFSNIINNYNKKQWQRF